MDRDEAVAYVEESIGYRFNNKEYLLEALTHSSFKNEMKINRRPDYERLEFLGDAVLELISSEFLYDRYPTVPEGGLSKKRASIVCEPSLAICARRMGLGKAIFMGKGEEATGGRERDSVLCDVTESVLGAIYLDSGIEMARKYVYSHILNDLKEDELFVDSKSKLQEIIQRDYPGKEFIYKLVEESGPEHAKVFKVSACLDGKILSVGEGKTKKSAQQMAAHIAIQSLENGKED
ncbi:MAG: ribonuclease III [Lachnospiraceae bacterium]|nr:ribonuclease III [Lachnospiraceae bacterium]